MKAMVTLVVVLFLLSIAGGTEGLNHQGGGSTGQDITHSGIDLRGYHWVVLENDDWGGGALSSIANATEADELAEDGTRTLDFSTNATLESVSDLDDYFAVFEKHPKAVVTPYFIMEFMNGTAMLDNGFTEYVGIPINKTGFIEETKFNSSGPNYRGDVQSKWVEGYTKGYWLPQYHGRFHIDMTWLLQNCSEGCETTINSVVNHSVGVKILPGEEWTALHREEYQNNILLTIQLGECNKSTEEAQENLTIGLGEFYNLFGYHAESTIAPAHRVSNNTLAAFRNTTICGMGSAPGFGLNETGVKNNWDWHVFDYFDGISVVGRNNDFTTLNITHLTTVMDKINTTFDRGQVAIIGDHNVGYCSGIRDTTMPGERNSTLELLDAVLTGIETWYPDVWYLTSPELHQLNIHGYSIQNWSDKVVVRNALPTTQSIIVNLPSGWNSDLIRITDDDGAVRGFTPQSLSRILLKTPHNETFTIRQFTPLPGGGSGEDITKPLEETPEESDEFCCSSTAAVVATCVSWLGIVGYTRRRRS